MLGYNESVRLAIDNICKESLNDIFGRPFEVDIFANKDFAGKIAEKIRLDFEKISKIDLDEGADVQQLVECFGIHPIQHVLMPKKEPFDFRRCALIHPLDELKYLSLVISFADDVEKARVAASDKIVFSYRYAPNDGYIFDQASMYTTFREAGRERAKAHGGKVLIHCDIANFYDRLNLHRLESILLSMPIEKRRVKLLNEVLLFWANRDSYGLPVGSNASRVLAEAALIEVDNHLISYGIDFIRYVDDYRMFATDVKQAHYWLSILIDRLAYEGLMINHNKTKIELVGA